MPKISGKHLAIGGAFAVIGAGLAFSGFSSKERPTGVVLQPSQSFSQLPLSIDAKLDGCILSIRKDTIADKLFNTPGSRMELKFSAKIDGDLGGLTLNDPRIIHRAGSVKRFVLSYSKQIGEKMPDSSMLVVDAESSLRSSGDNPYAYPPEKSGFKGEVIFNNDEDSNSIDCLIPPVAEQIEVEARFFKTDKIDEKPAEKTTFYLKPNMKPIVHSTTVIGFSFNDKQTLPLYVTGDEQLIAAVNRTAGEHSRLFIVPIDTGKWNTSAQPFYEDLRTADARFFVIPEGGSKGSNTPGFYSGTRSYLTPLFLERMNDAQFAALDQVIDKINNVVHPIVAKADRDSFDGVAIAVEKQIPASIAFLLSKGARDTLVYGYPHCNTPKTEESRNFASQFAISSLCCLGKKLSAQYSQTLSAAKSLKGSDKELLHTVLNQLDTFRGLSEDPQLYKELFPEHKLLERLRADLKHK